MDILLIFLSFIAALATAYLLMISTSGVCTYFYVNDAWGSGVDGFKMIPYLFFFTIVFTVIFYVVLRRERSRGRASISPEADTQEGRPNSLSKPFPIVVLLLVTLMGWMIVKGFYTRMGVNNSVKTISEQASSQPTPTDPAPTLTIMPLPDVTEPPLQWPSPRPMHYVDTTNWKTYTDEAYGLALKYPSNWNMVKPPVVGGRSDVVLTPETLVQTDKKAAKDLVGIEVTGEKSIIRCTDSAAVAQQEITGYLGLKRDEMRNTPNSEMQYLSITPLNVPGISGYVADNGLPGQNSMPEPGSDPIAIIYRCPAVFEIRFRSVDATDGRPLFDTILSTLEVRTPIKVWTPNEPTPN